MSKFLRKNLIKVTFFREGFYKKKIVALFEHCHNFFLYFLFENIKKWLKKMMTMLIQCKKINFSKIPLAFLIKEYAKLHWKKQQSLFNIWNMPCLLASAYIVAWPTIRPFHLSICSGIINFVSNFERHENTLVKFSTRDWEATTTCIHAHIATNIQ